MSGKEGPADFGSVFVLPISIALIGGVGGAGACFVVVSRAPDERANRYFALPATRRDRVLFLFSEGARKADTSVYPALSFGDLTGDGPARAAIEAEE